MAIENVMKSELLTESEVLYDRRRTYETILELVGKGAKKMRNFIVIPVDDEEALQEYLDKRNH